MAHLRDHFDSGESGRSLGFWYFHMEALLSKNYFSGRESGRQPDVDAVKNLLRWVLSGVALDMHLAMRMNPPSVSHAANLMSLLFRRQSNNLGTVTMMSSASTVIHGRMPMLELLSSFCNNRVVEPPRLPGPRHDQISRNLRYEYGKFVCWS